MFFFCVFFLLQIGGGVWLTENLSIEAGRFVQISPCRHERWPSIPFPSISSLSRYGIEPPQCIAAENIWVQHSPSAVAAWASRICRRSTPDRSRGERRSRRAIPITSAPTELHFFKSTAAEAMP